jgi:uridine phosphorylase
MTGFPTAGTANLHPQDCRCLRTAVSPTWHCACGPEPRLQEDHNQERHRMSYPQQQGKHAFTALVDPHTWLQYVKERGDYPTCDVPAGAIICYDSGLWRWVRERPDRVEGDGMFRGYFLIPWRGVWVLAGKAAGVGAPVAVIAMEEMIAFGIRRFVNLGTAGGLQRDLKVGDLVVCDRALRDEGTSHHYLPASRFAAACPTLTGALVDALRAAGRPPRTGASWTTDAPYRETIEELRAYRDEGILTVEMEAAAVFALGRYRHAGVGSVFAVSDILDDAAWTPGFHTAEVTEALRTAFERALDSLAALAADETTTTAPRDAGPGTGTGVRA